MHFLLIHVQFVNEFSRVVEVQHSSYLACKLKWLELQPQILAAAESERDNPTLQLWISRCSDEADEGIWNKIIFIQCIHAYIRK